MRSVSALPTAPFSMTQIQNAAMAAIDSGSSAVARASAQTASARPTMVRVSSTDGKIVVAFKHQSANEPVRNMDDLIAERAGIACTILCMTDE